MTGHVYILLSRKDQRTYVGSTNNISKRLSEHNQGKVKATLHRRPLQLIFTEKCDTIESARVRERYYKSAAGRKQMKRLLFSQL